MVEIGRVYRKRPAEIEPAEKKVVLPISISKESRELKAQVTNQIEGARSTCASFYGLVSNKFPECEIAATLRNGMKGKIREAKSMVG